MHNVGYPRQNFSHFVSIKLWSSAGDHIYDPRHKSGWMGRKLIQDFPSLVEAPPTVPPAIRIGFATDHMFLAPGNQSMELVFNNPGEFHQLAQEGKLYPTDTLGDCPSGVERSFLRSITNNSQYYSDNVTRAYNSSQTKVTYPTGTTNNLAGQLSIVARLIKGNLGTKVYMVYINGWDTHANQRNTHRNLTGHVANSVAAFYNDLKADDASKNVTIMTFSEFGRTIRENGSAGTDHGNQSPLMIFGDPVKGGFTGTPINLHDGTLDNGGARIYFENQPSIDYRSVYQTVLEDFLCLDPELTEYTMGQKLS